MCKCFQLLIAFLALSVGLLVADTALAQSSNSTAIRDDFSNKREIRKELKRLNRIRDRVKRRKILRKQQRRYDRLIARLRKDALLYAQELCREGKCNAKDIGNALADDVILAFVGPRPTLARTEAPPSIQCTESEAKCPSDADKSSKGGRNCCPKATHECMGTSTSLGNFYSCELKPNLCRASGGTFCSVDGNDNVSQCCPRGTSCTSVSIKMLGLSLGTSSYCTGCPAGKTKICKGAKKDDNGMPLSTCCAENESCKENYGIPYCSANTCEKDQEVCPGKYMNICCPKGACVPAPEGNPNCRFVPTPTPTAIPAPVPPTPTPTSKPSPSMTSSPSPSPTGSTEMEVPSPGPSMSATSSPHASPSQVYS